MDRISPQQHSAQGEYESIYDELIAKDNAKMSVDTRGYR